MATPPPDDAPPRWSTSAYGGAAQRHPRGCALPGTGRELIGASALHVSPPQSPPTVVAGIEPRQSSRSNLDVGPGTSGPCPKGAEHAARRSIATWVSIADDSGGGAVIGVIGPSRLVPPRGGHLAVVMRCARHGATAPTPLVAICATTADRDRQGETGNWRSHWLIQKTECPTMQLQQEGTCMAILSKRAVSAKPTYAVARRASFGQSGSSLSLSIMRVKLEISLGSACIGHLTCSTPLF